MGRAKERRIHVERIGLAIEGATPNSFTRVDVGGFTRPKRAPGPTLGRGNCRYAGPTLKLISHDRGVGVGLRYRFPHCFRLVPEQHECGVPPANETEEHTGSDGPCGAL